MPSATGWNDMDSTQYDPSYWNTLDTIVSSSSCIDRLGELNFKLHGKQRQILRENINRGFKLREKTVQDGSNDRTRLC